MTTSSCSPQRYLGNHRNMVRTATLVPSHVRPVANAVIESLRARTGTAQLKITGDYAGFDDATYDFEIVDDGGSSLISAPAYTGVGSETLENIATDGTLPAQDFKVECHSAGQPAVAAAVDVGGVSIVARSPGDVGNGIHIHVDVSGISFADTTFSLIEAVTKGAGAEDSPLTGPQYDWNTATVGADGIIPDSAQRIAFEGDDANIYLQYKKFVDGEWKYFFVPALQNDYPAGSKVRAVSGTYTVTISTSDSPPSTDTLSDIVTFYDFLNLVKTTSTLADVKGVVANDRTPSGQAAREFPLRTQARALLSTGEGSKVATGFAGITVQPDAFTELVTAECIAIDSKLDPNAFVGHEAWELKGSVSGDLGVIYTGETFAGPKFSLVIPQKLPKTSGNGAATISLTDFSRGDADAPFVKVCFAGKVGPNAVDQTITLTYTQRPPPTCDCEDMVVPELNTACLGGKGGDISMGWSPEAQTRINALYDWARDLADSVSSYSAGKSLAAAPADAAPPSADVTASETFAAPGTTGTVSFTSTETSQHFTTPKLADAGYGETALPQTFFDLLDYYEAGLRLIDGVTDSTLKADGLDAFDDAVSAWQADLAGSTLGSLGNRIATFSDVLYKTMVRRAVGRAGLNPSGKANANILTSGDGCWQDYGDPFFWKVVGSDGEYAPAFTSTPGRPAPYWSSRKHDDGAYYSTHEFAFVLNVKCPENLRLGDTITIQIGNSAALGTYQVGDVLKLPIIAAADAFLVGGINADKIQSWYVTGSVTGALSPYVFDPDSPTAYSDSGLSFQLVMHGVDPGAGDTFLFSVIGGTYRWRKDGGAWSSPAPIPATATAFDSGLSLQFVSGIKPSFVASDTWTFRAIQQWSAEGLRSPDLAKWFPDNAAPTLEADAAEIVQIDAIAIAQHTIPEGATIEVAGGDVIGVEDWRETLTWQAGVIAKLVDHTASWVRLELSGADGASVGWFFAGQADQTELAADVKLRRDYRLERSSTQGGLDQGGVFQGKAISGTVEYTEGALSEADVAKLIELIDESKANNDEPFIFIPQQTRPQDALLCQIVEDNIDLPDVFDYQPNADRPRRLSAQLSLQGVWT